MQDLKEQYDVIVVGGGVNGVGIARDCALRGISCLLVEKNDYSAGTSWASSGMIHGGPRYMLGDPEVTKLSCLDSGYIQKIAPHLLFRIPFLYPVYKKEGGSGLATQVLLEATETFFEAYDKFVPLKNGKSHTRLSAAEAVELEPQLPAENLLGAVTFDEWGIDVPRLCVINAMDAAEHGATVLNHTEVVDVHFENQAFQGVTITDHLTDKTQKVRGKYLINATGPWAPKFAKKMGLDIKLRPGKGIHLVFERRLVNMAIATQAIDGREMFVMPYENTTIIATTDDDYFGDLDDQRSQQDEIEYLKESIEKIFPQIKNARMIYSYSGVRPTLYERGKMESSLSREHEVVDHEITDQVKGVVSLIGGKLASYRVMAEETVDLVAKKLGNELGGRTHLEFLPGGDGIPDVKKLTSQFGLDPYTISRLVYRHGSRALKILDQIAAKPELGVHVCSCEPVTAAEILYVIEHEQARTLADVRRRTRLAQGPCQGTDCLTAASGLFSKLNPDRDIASELQDFQDEWWWNRAAILNPSQAKQEELFQALQFCNNGLDSL